jgi:hypothetical protein
MGRFRMATNHKGEIKKALGLRPQAKKVNRRERRGRRELILRAIAPAIRNLLLGSSA